MTPRSVTVCARRWFNRTYGNTYHSVVVAVDGVIVGVAPYSYGYGNQWETTAEEILTSAGIIDQDRNGALRYRLKDAGIAYFADVVDVPRRKDLLPDVPKKDPLEGVPEHLRP